MTAMRIILRKLTSKDTALFYAWWNDQELRRLTSDSSEQMSKQEVEDKIAQHLLNKDYFDFIVEADQKPVGHLLIKEEKSEFVFYIAISEKDYWNKGIGTEATRLACKWFFENFPQEESLLLEVHDSNHRAIHVYEKIGFEKIGECRYKNARPTNKMAIRRDTFNAG